MRILHLSMLYPPHVIGGAERSVAALAEAQRAAGHVVAAACTTPGSFSEEDRHGITVFRMPHETSFWAEDWARHAKLRRAYRKFAQQFNVRLERHFAEVIARFRPDIVHSHSMVDVTTRCWLAAARAGVPIVHTLRDYDLICADSTMFHGGAGCGVKCRVMTLAKRPHHRRIAAVSALSRDTLEIHRARGLFAHLGPGKIDVVPNGIERGTALDRRERKGPMRFGFLGRISPEKGLGMLIAAVRDLSADAPWELHVGGTGQPDEIERMTSLASGRPIHFLGQVDSAAFLADIDVLVVPSVWVEPFGRIVGEAYAAGVPALGADVGGIAELVGRVDPGWLFRAGDTAALRERLLAILRDGRGALPAPAQFAAVLEDLTWQRIARRFDALYAKVLATS